MRGYKDEYEADSKQMRGWVAGVTSIKIKGLVIVWDA